MIWLLMKFAFSAASELAGELEIPEEAAHWKKLNEQLPELDVDKDGALTFAKGFSYDQSHRHFSHAMAIHPLGLLDWSQGEKSQQIIKATIKKLQDYGPDYWTGYSYSWFGNMKARAFDGDGAAGNCVHLLNVFACVIHFMPTATRQKQENPDSHTVRLPWKVTLPSLPVPGNAFAKPYLESSVYSRRSLPTGRMSLLITFVPWVLSLSLPKNKTERSPNFASILNRAEHYVSASPFGTDEAVVTGNAGDVTNEDGILSFETRKGEWVDIKPADHRIG